MNRPKKDRQQRAIRELPLRIENHAKEKNMKKSILLFAATAALALCMAACAHTPKKETSKMTSVYQFTVKTIDGKDKNLADYSGKTLLIVNVASKCGFTPQYKELETMYENYKDRGFVILAFPSNDFGGQEPGTNEEIKAFCDLNYHVTFDLFDKVHAKEDPIAPLYLYLTTNAGFDGPIGWNFTKFLVDKNGKVIGRWASNVKPTDPELLHAVENAL
jgi:glutathione peroxidase